MSFRERIIKRTVVYGIYCLVGVFLILTGIFTHREMPLTLGVAFSIMGAVRLMHYFSLLKNPQKLESREIAESDERNLFLAYKARSLAFSWFVSLSGFAILICFFAGQMLIGQVIAYELCAIVLLYWVIYLILKKRN